MSTPSKLNRSWHVHAAGVVVCLLLTGAAYVTAIQPVADAQVRDHLQRSELAQNREQASELEHTLASLHRQMGQITRDLAASELELQSAGRINQRIADLTEMANAAGVRIQQIQPGRKQSEELFDAVPIELSGHASYRDHLLFLRDLHARFPDIAVAEFKVTGEPRGNAQAARFHLRLCWFTARETVAGAQP